MDPIDIQYELKKRHITQKQIADELGVSPMAVSKEIAGHNISERIRHAISRSIGKSPQDVFPGYYCSRNRRPIRKPITGTAGSGFSDKPIHNDKSM